MANDDSSEDASFAELMAGVKKISDDRINIYRDRVKKTTQPRSRTQAPESSLDFVDISFDQQTNIKDSQFDTGIQKNWSVKYAADN